MKDKFLLVPGTSGTKLLLDGKDFGWPVELAIKSWAAGLAGSQAIAAAAGLSANDIVKAMSMEFADDSNWFPTKTTLLPGRSMTSGPVLSVAYNQFRDFEQFSYDWRSDIRGSGKKLLRFLRDNKPTGGRWRIVSHSQGGLAVVVASKLAAEQAGGSDTVFSELVSRVVLLAVPLAGTQKAAMAVVNADNLSDGFSKEFRKIAVTWPALYQMLPVWQKSVMVKNAAGKLVPATFPLMNAKAWGGYPVVAQNLVRAAETRKVFFRSPLAAMSGVKVSIAMTRSHATETTAVLDGTTLSFGSAGMADHGDSLVPYETTLSTFGDLERSCTRFFGKPNDSTTGVHYMVANDPLLASYCKQFLGA